MSEVTDLAGLVQQAMRGPNIIEVPDGRTLAMLPEPNGAYSLKDITRSNKLEVLLPKTITQAVQLQDVTSIVDYIRRFRDVNSMAFADIDNNAVLAVMDYHKESDTAEGFGQARLGKHTARMHLPFSLEWKTWNAISGKLMSHKDFATFLEENAIDVFQPAGGELLDLCRDLQVSNNVAFSSSVRHGDYNKISFAKENDATSKGDISLPLSIVLKIPVYFGGDIANVTAFMRRKIDDGDLFLGVQLSRAENIRQSVFRGIVDHITSGTGLTTVYGKPE